MASDLKIELSVVACMFNEEAIIERNIDRLAAYLNTLPFSWELILVNDGSTDATLEILNKKAADPRIRVVSYSHNRGRGYALRRGFQASRGTYVVTVESDLNYGVDIISEMMETLKNGSNAAIVASPYMPGGRIENVPLKRSFLSQLGNKVLRMAFDLPIHTFTGMTRCYKGDIIRSLPLKEDSKDIHLEILSQLSMLGFSVSEVPAILKWETSKPGKQKRKSKFKAKKLILSHLLFGFHEAPILLFGSLGGLLLSCGVLCGLYLSFLHFILGAVIGDRIVLITLTVFLNLAGLSMFVFCFLAYQIKMVRKELFNLSQKMTSPIE